MYLCYPVKLTADGFGTVYALCPDIPEAMTYAESREEAAAKVRGAIEGALELYRQQGRPVPRPRKIKADFTVAIPSDGLVLAPAPSGSSRRIAETALSMARGWIAQRY